MSCGMYVVAVFVALVAVLITAPFWGTLSGFVYKVAPIVIFFVVVFAFSKLFSK
jgi:hypothetical protein